MKHAWLSLRPWQRHSLVLAVAGGLYVLIGMTYLLTPDSRSREASLKLALFVPLEVWGVVWIVVGVLALTSTRWPPQSKTWGYTALSGLAAAWGSAFLLGVLLLGAPASGLNGAWAYYLLAFLWWAISGLSNPDDVPNAG